MRNFAGPLFNIGWQIVLWVTLAVALWAHQWAPGLIALFGLGSVMNIDAFWLEFGIMRQHFNAQPHDQSKTIGLTARLQQFARRLRGIGLTSWLLFATISVSVAGNVTDLGFMWHLGVPLGERDLWLGLFALSAFCLLAPTARFIPGFPTEKRLYVVLGFCCRTVVLAAQGGFALHDHTQPMPPLSLLAITFITCQFTWQARKQHKRTPSAESKALQIMYGLGLLALFILCLAAVWAAI